MEIRYTLAPDAQDLAPTKAHPDDAAFDIRANADMTVAPCKVALVPTGLALELPYGYEAQIRPRSGLAIKKAVTILNTPGTVDAGYRGEVKVILFNAGDEDFHICRGDRIAQMVIQTLPEVELVKADALSETTRGANGFGSTGQN